ncbi:MAG: hypothetical protein IJ493_02325 [Clostridia bacterium]|nr:hypothetical protein [Clostridia bacterium]
MFKKATLLLLIGAMLTSAASCGTTSDVGTDTTTSGDTTTAAPEGYDYSGKNYNGKTFRVFGMDDIYTMHMKFDRDESNGEILNDAIYDRNRLVEDKLNVVIEETTVATFAEVNNTLGTSILSGDDICDLALIPPSTCCGIIIEGYFKDLRSIGSWDLDAEWYNQSYNDAVTLNGKMYFGMSDATIALTDGIWALFFNEDMMENLKMDKPYDLVRDGTWTTDKLISYLKAAASLNGDEDWSWHMNGNAVYGLSTVGTTHYRVTNAMGEKLVENQDGKLVFTAGTDRFYSVIDKLRTLMDTSSGAVYFGGTNGGDFNMESGQYLAPFPSQRTLFQTAEICKTQSFRELEFDYGVVPYPKYDENQSSYYSPIFEACVAFSIPITAPDAEFSASVWDALAYEGGQSVVPAYREVTLEQKGLRNDDSIEMLGIITDSAFPDAGSMFGISGSFRTEFNTEITNNTGAMASIIDKHKTSIQEKIDELVDAIG